MDQNDCARVEQRIGREHADVIRLVDALSTELDEIVESMSLSNNDDEHDPDGATNGYERAKATAMLRHAQERVVDLDRALARLHEGTYGRCLRCGDQIASERLDALIAASQCLRCAGREPDMYRA